MSIGEYTHGVIAFFENLSLTSWWGILALYVLVLLCVVLGLYRFFKEGKGKKNSLITLTICAIFLTALVWAVMELWWRPFPDPLPAPIYITVAVALWCIGALFTLKKAGSFFATSSLIALICVPLVANAMFKSYPDIASMIPNRYAVSMSYEEFQGRTEAPHAYGKTVGALISLDLPGTDSGFNARNAEVYIPPAYWTQPRRDLPVLVLMAGNPGSPSDWIRSGELTRTADEYQAQHNGRAPVVVSVDATGSLTGNPICVDSPIAKVQTYVAKDVPQQMKEKFRVGTDQKQWIIGGLSYGGTCALQVVANAPHAFGSFLDFSGQIEPTIGKHDETVQKFFGGDEAAFQKVNPETILKKAAGSQEFSGIAGRFIAGDQDTSSVEALTQLNDLAQKAGMDTQLTTVQGKHDFGTWRTALRETFSWVAMRGGIQGDSSSNTQGATQ